MASAYFDEHDCIPLPDGETPNFMTQLARLLVDTGAWDDDAFREVFNGGVPPPASKKWMEEEMDVKMIREEKDEKQCPICLKVCEQDDIVASLPCKHGFHKECIEPWLKKTSSCPLCRHELPTDDHAWEEMKKQKKRAKQRKEDIETLHDSMFG